MSLTDKTNQELWEWSDHKIHGVIRAAQEARKRAITLQDVEAIMDCDGFICAAYEVHRSGLSLKKYAPDITPSFGGK